MKITLKCMVCDDEKKIDLGGCGIFGGGKPSLDDISENGWKIIKVLDREGYCCERCQEKL